MFAIFAGNLCKIHSVAVMTGLDPGLMCLFRIRSTYTHRIHGAAIYGNMDPINIPPLC